MTIPRHRRSTLQSESFFESFFASVLGKVVAQIGILVVAVANGYAVYFLAILIGSMDASGKTIYFARILGYVWIALFTCAAYIIGLKKGWGIGLAVSASAIPAFVFLGEVVVEVVVFLRAISG